MKKHIYDLAVETVLPDGGEPSEYQENEIGALIQFGRLVLENEGLPTPRALDFAICAPEYHASLDEAGDRFCRMCGQPLSQ